MSSSNHKTNNALFQFRYLFQQAFQAILSLFVLQDKLQTYLWYKHFQSTPLNAEENKDRIRIKNRLNHTHFLKQLVRRSLSTQVYTRK